jgi:hypothetical protein
VAMDISGWLHTVSTDTLTLDKDLGPGEYYPFGIKTEGYRRISLIIKRKTGTTWHGKATVMHFIQSIGKVVCRIEFPSIYPTSSKTLTYEITMNRIGIDFKNMGTETIKAGEVMVLYYMTT